LKCGFGSNEKISRVDKVTNVEVLQKVEENRSILNTAQQQKLRWIGHILRHESLLREVMEGRKGKGEGRKQQEDENGYKC